MKLSFKDQKHPEVELKPGRLTIGRDPENDVVLDKDDISGFHAEIHHDNGKLSLVDLGSTNGSFHQGKKINGRVELRAWDEISFGSVVAELIDPSSRRPTKAMPAIGAAAASKAPAVVDDPNLTKARPSVGAWVLMGVSDDVKGSKASITKTITVGRDESCELTLPNDMASRQHARIHLENGRLSVEDLGSTNGTLVNGKKIDERTVLKDGDEIRLDTTRYRVIGAGGDTDKTAARPAVAATAARPAAGTPAKFRADGGRPIDLTGKATIGRLSDNDIVLDDDTVSGRHARIEPDGQNWKLVDLGSSNGTLVNGKKIKEATLTGGETVSFGELKLTFDAARSSGTRHVPSAGGASTRTGTRKQTAIDGTSESARTRTAKASAVDSGGVPAWAWGLMGFAVVAVVLGAWMFRDHLGFGPSQIDAPLQAGTTWQHQLGSEGDRRRVVSTPVMADVNGDGVLGLVVGDLTGQVTAFDGQEGKRIFSVSVPGRIVASLAAADLTGDGADEVVVGTTNGRVFVINGRGLIVWESDAGLELGEVTNRPVFARVNEDNVPDVIVPTSRRGLVALDGARGWKIWSTEEMSSGAVISSPVVGDFNEDGVMDFAYVTDQGQAVAISATDGRVWQLWDNADIGKVDYASPALIVADRQPLLLFATQAGVSALHAGTGRMAWSNRLGATYIASPLGVAVAERRSHDVVVLSAQGTIRLLSGTSGDEIWDFNVGREIQASPASFDFTGNGVSDFLVQTTDGRLIVVDAERGRAVLETSLSGAGSITASPLLGDLTRDGLLEVSMVDELGNVRVLSMNRTVRAGRAPWPRMLGNDQHSVAW